MTKVMLILANSFFKPLHEILAPSFSDTGFALYTLHLKVWKNPNIPFKLNTWVSSSASRNTLSGISDKHDSML